MCLRVVGGLPDLISKDHHPSVYGHVLQDEHILGRVFGEVQSLPCVSFLGHLGS